MRNYVYALIDPERGNVPFYIGKGIDNRLQSHFKAAAKLATKKNIEIVGCDTHSVLEDATADAGIERLARIVELRKRGFDHTHIARIIARRMDDQTASDVESFLIRSVFGIGQLTNRVEGAHAERFREAGDDRFIDDFDLDFDASDSERRKIEARFGRYYVYTLRDPNTKRIFYIGKGSGRRMFAHFDNAAKPNSMTNSDGHLRLLSQLVAKGHRPRAICRIQGRVDQEQKAFALEALLMKFVHGLTSVDNQVAGHHGEMFRAKGDWERRRGFDLPYICDPDLRTNRSDKRDGMIGEGLAVPLFAIAAAFPDLAFDPPEVRDSGELGIQTNLVPRHGGVGARLKVFIRRRKLQLELRGRKKAQAEWMESHFTLLNAFPFRRREFVFLPDVWLGPANMTDDLDEICRRIRLMQEIVNAKNADALSPEARSVLTRRSSPVES